MKKWIVVLLLFISTHSLFANFTAVHVAGGTVTPLSNTKIELVTEDIVFEILDNKWNVSLDYDFINKGEDDEVTLGFPKWRLGVETYDPALPLAYNGPNDFDKIIFTINGEKRSFSIKKNSDQKPEDYYLSHGSEPVIFEWCLIKHTFPKNQHVNISVKYTSVYGQAGFDEMADYLFGTGGTWYSNIKRLKIRIEIASDIWVRRFYITNIVNYKLSRTDNKNFEVVLRDLEPEYHDIVGFNFDAKSDYIFNWSCGIYTMDKSKRQKYDNRKLDIENVQMLSKSNLLKYRAFFRALAGYPCEYQDVIDYLKENKITIDKSIRNLESWKYNISLIDEYIAKADIKYDARIEDVSASSFIDYKNMYHPASMFDGKLDTAWLEKKEGSGIGEWVRLALDKEITIDEISFAPGYFDPKWYGANNRLKELRVIANGKKYDVTFKDEMKVQSCKLENPISFKEIQFTILDVYKSKKDDDAAISEMQFFCKSKEILLQ
jgi:hypothetical protein